jgi:hypothetical protein
MTVYWLPSIEMVSARALATSKRKSDQPKHQEHGCDAPQEVSREPKTEEQQDNQKSQ